MRLLTLFISCVLVLQVCTYRPANNDELDELLDELDIKQEDQVNKRHYHDYHRQRNVLDDDDENEIDYDLDDFVSDEEDDDPDNYSQHFNDNHGSDFDSNAEDEFENDGKRRQQFEEQHQDLKSKSHSKKQIIKLDEIKTSTLRPTTAKPTTAKPTTAKPTTKAPPTTTTPPPTTTQQPTTTNTQPSPKRVPIATSKPSSANRKRPMYNRRYRLQLLLKRLRSLRRMRERTSHRHHKKYFGRYLKKYHTLEILQRYGCHRISCVRHHSSLCICRDRQH